MSETWQVNVTEKTPEESVVMFTQGVSVRSVAAVHHDVGVWLAQLAAQAQQIETLKRALKEVMRQDTFWRDGGSGNQYGPCAEVARGALASLNPEPPTGVQGIACTCGNGDTWNGIHAAFCAKRTTGGQEAKA